MCSPVLRVSEVRGQRPRQNGQEVGITASKPLQRAAIAYKIRGDLV